MGFAKLKKYIKEQVDYGSGWVLPGVTLNFFGGKNSHKIVLYQY